MKMEIGRRKRLNNRNKNKRKYGGGRNKKLRG